MSDNKDKKSPIIFFKYHYKDRRESSGKLSFMDILTTIAALLL